MKCDIIQDLLSLYCDEVCSTETVKAVEAHLDTCPACRTLCDKMRQNPVIPEPIQVQAQQEAKVFRGIKRKISLRRRLSVSAVALVALVTLVILTASSNIEKPIPYQEGLGQFRLYTCGYGTKTISDLHKPLKNSIMARCQREWAFSASLLPFAATWQTRVSPIRSVWSKLILLSIPAEWNATA